MTWVYPESLWGFVFVILIIIAAYIARHHKLRKLKVIGRNRMEWQIRISLRDFSMAVFMILGILATAEPRSGKEPISGEWTGLDVAVAFDVSRSMLAEDISPNRLERSIIALGQIIRVLDDARFSLIPFKGDAIIRVPMTEDRVILNLWLDRLGPGLSTSTGTNLEVALGKASDSFPGGVGRSQVILLITDGESLAGHINRFIQDFIQEGIPVHIIIAGTEEGGIIPLGNEQYVTDESGHLVVSRADFKVLERLAEDTGGSFHPLSHTSTIADIIEVIKKNREFVEARGISFTGVYQYRMYLVPSLLMLLLYLLARIFPWRKR